MRQIRRTVSFYLRLPRLVEGRSKKAPDESTAHQRGNHRRQRHVQFRKKFVHAWRRNKVQTIADDGRIYNSYRDRPVQVASKAVITRDMTVSIREY